MKRQPRTFWDHRHESPSCRAQAGFTLLELVLVMAILVTVLVVAYQVVVDCLETDRTVDRIALPEKVGEGLMLVLRRDLAGTYFRFMGRRVFRIDDGGSDIDARDELRLFTTVAPTPIEELEGGANSVFETHTVTGVYYYLRPTDHDRVRDVPTYTLFRKEMVLLDPEMPLDSVGTNYELYDKVAYFSVEPFDGLNWLTEWDSEYYIDVEEQEMAILAAEGREGVARVSDPLGNRSAIVSGPGTAPSLEPDALPPAAVPVAVRVTLGVYSGRGSSVDTDPDGQPILKEFSATIPIIASRRVPMDLDSMEGDDSMVGGVGDVAGSEDSTNTMRGAATTPDGRGGRGSGRAGVRGRPSTTPATSR